MIATPRGPVRATSPTAIARELEAAQRYAQHLDDLEAERARLRPTAIEAIQLELSAGGRRWRKGEPEVDGMGVRLWRRPHVEELIALSRVDAADVLRCLRLPSPVGDDELPVRIAWGVAFGFLSDEAPDETLRCALRLYHPAALAIGIRSLEPTSLRADQTEAGRKRAKQKAAVYARMARAVRRGMADLDRLLDEPIAKLRADRLSSGPIPLSELEKALAMLERRAQAEPEQEPASEKRRSTEQRRHHFTPIVRDLRDDRPGFWGPSHLAALAMSRSWAVPLAPGIELRDAVNLFKAWLRRDEEEEQGTNEP